MDTNGGVSATILLLIVAAGCLHAQGSDGVEERLRDLERQRVLWRTAQQARVRGDLLEAARFFGEGTRLSHLVPVPYSTSEPRAVLGELATTLLKRGVEKARDAFRNEAAEKLGGPCKLCSGRGFRVCSLCGGRGLRETVKGRRAVDEPCDPCRTCGTCNGRGRETEGAAPEFVRFQAVAIELSQRANPLEAIDRLFRSLDGLDFHGLRLPYDDGRTLRDLVPAPPFDAQGLRGDAKAALKRIWPQQTPVARAMFLQGLGLETLDQVRGLSFLADAPKGTTAAAIKKDAVAVKTSEIPWLSTDDLQKPLAVLLTWEENNDITKVVDVPLVGKLWVRHGDPLVVTFYAFTPGDLDRLRTLAKLKLLPGVDQTVKSYPPRSVPKALLKLGPGVPVRALGRVHKNPRGFPAFLFEIWDVEEAGEDPGK